MMRIGVPSMVNNAIAWTTSPPLASSRDTNQRIFWRLITIARGKVGGSLDVRVVIRTAGGRADKPNP